MKFGTNIVSAILACMAGILLCHLNSYFAGYLAALAIPREYSSWFGTHVYVYLVSLDLFSYVLPMFAVATLWGIMTSAILRTRQLLPAVSSAFAYMLVWLLMIFGDGPGTSVYAASLSNPPALFLFLLHLIPGPAGLLIGGYVLLKSKLRAPRALPRLF